MKLSKKDRDNLLQEICDDMEDWDEEALRDWAKEARYNDLDSLDDETLFNEYCQNLNIEPCDHCGHVDATGACFHCKMD
jgi:hypothetical protein|tara:strand:+ start:338 stop:574 length:237 start_codon:yes stop_codon:yes gene_type:complete